MDLDEHARVQKNHDEQRQVEREKTGAHHEHGRIEKHTIITLNDQTTICAHKCPHRHRGIVGRVRRLTGRAPAQKDRTQAQNRADDPRERAVGERGAQAHAARAVVHGLICGHVAVVGDDDETPDGGCAAEDVYGEPHVTDDLAEDPGLECDEVGGEGEHGAAEQQIADRQVGDQVVADAAGLEHSVCRDGVEDEYVADHRADHEREGEDADEGWEQVGRVQVHVDQFDRGHVQE